MTRQRARGLLGAWALCGLLAGCAHLPTGVGYYWQSLTGHLRLMHAARPIGHWLQDAQTPPELRQKLMAAQRMRVFAVQVLALPDNASYQRYADLQRRAAVYNVVAAPELSLRLHHWCFPLVGCVGYRGYYNEAHAQAYAASLPPELETVVYPVPAYSTLGWLNWAGGDPLLSTFIGYPEAEVARLVFHELAHQVVFVPGDTAFNESFATAVERLGGQRWLAQAPQAVHQDFAVFDARRQAFRELTLRTRTQLQAIYEDERLGDALKRQRKHAAMAQFHQAYQALRASWGGYAGFDAWVARANNAQFGAQAVYGEWVPAFERLFEQQGGAFVPFYDAVRALADMPPPQRRERLQALMPTALH